ncbi:lysine-sensitive aspartokinase 3 [Bacteriovorax sp. DB6_IX]|uniref:lysine-sensitive aspartokinase 3 n=1 Tax=Bacteriovorax sp. DB6_IX TaxID=1353530 RepID=UPI000389E1F4|nr:lysine-sensitive aspartokinase 3 [Bacteriovorax sp. DB6_IX]EQC50515.1 putative aspartate kinase, monofunctional class [Bacteriovorax sp. DB6_IX]
MSEKIIVAKFGGSSMADLTAMKRSASVSRDQKANVVVVSAVYGVTNLLIALSENACKHAWENVEQVYDEIVLKHHSILEQMQADDTLYSQVDELLKQAKTLAHGMFLLRECSLKAYDSLVSLGERLSSTIFAQVLANEYTGKDVQWFDVRKVMRTDDDYTKAKPQIEEIAQLCNKHLIDAKYGNTVFVTQGFIGSTSDEMTTTLGRGGSDYSAALLAEGLGADILQIWTDVAGIATTDPRIVPEARLLGEITYSEAAELATFGAKILHPTTLTPALRSNVQVFVGSSYEPNEPGTWIKTETESTPLVRAMAMRKGQSLLTLSTPKMLHSHGFLYEIFKVFNDFKVSIDSITTSEISVALTLDDSTLLNSKIIETLGTLCDVKVEEGLSLVSLIGNDINHTPNLAAKIFNSLEGINVRMICLGASKHNFCFLVKESEATECIQRLHKEFIG